MQFDPASYLAGLIDGEGHVAYKRYGRRISRSVCVVNTDAGVIAGVERALAELGIEWYRYDRLTRSGKDLYEVRIATRAGLARILDVVPIQHPAKAVKLREAVASYRADPPWAEVRRLREEEGLSGARIAERLGVPKSTAELWVRKLNETRKRQGRPKTPR